MQMNQAKVIAGSTKEVGEDSKAIYTLELRYPRFIHAELMTHRVFSRNASSSRAIPVAKLIDQVESFAAAPISWGTNRPGMQAGDELEGDAKSCAQDAWHAAARDAVKHARVLMKAGCHKQVVNRVLEPFTFISVIVTSTDWDNFFKLRISPMAQPEIRDLAEKMKAAMESFRTTPLVYDDWHLPYITPEERKSQFIKPDLLAAISAARCARVSYLTHDGLAPDFFKDLDLAERLATENHASPFEHQACPAFLPEHSKLTRNFRGWIQHRALLGL